MDRTSPGLDPSFLSELKRVIAERDVKCTRCGYDLCGVPGPRCPECGLNVRELLRVADTTPWRLPAMRRQALARLVVRWVGRIALVPAGAAIGATLYWLWTT